MTYRLQPRSAHPLNSTTYFFHSISDYVTEFSFVKLEAALTDMVYMQFKHNYDLADDDEKSFIEKLIQLYIPTRQQLRDYLLRKTLCSRRTNTIANFFKIPSLHNHNPPCEQKINLMIFGCCRSLILWPFLITNRIFKKAISVIKAHNPKIKLRLR